MWKEGSIKVNGDIFHYWIKQYEEGSEWGIEGGRISKLMFKRLRVDFLAFFSFAILAW